MHCSYVDLNRRSDMISICSSVMSRVVCPQISSQYVAISDNQDPLQAEAGCLHIWLILSMTIINGRTRHRHHHRLLPLQKSMPSSMRAGIASKDGASTLRLKTIFVM